MKVLETGLLTTVQDLGRTGLQSDGVSPGGAMDRFALRVANLLVGNAPDTAGLEVTLEGPALEFEHDALITICGADLSASIADVALPRWRAIFVERGAVLRFGRRAWGCRAYLTIAGGISVPPVLGSRSTYLSARIGGVDGRAVARDDVLPIGEPSPRAVALSNSTRSAGGPLPFALTDVAISGDAEKLYGSQPVGFIRGPHFELLSSAERELLTSTTFRVSSTSDRMGYRLEGASLTSVALGDMASTAVATGAVQLPAGGQPVVLMAERQTTGGYPIVAVVATVDLPLVAQLAPGDELNFAEISLEDAQIALRKRERDLQEVLDRVGHDASDG